MQFKKNITAIVFCNLFIVYCHLIINKDGAFAQLPPQYMNIEYKQYSSDTIPSPMNVIPTKINGNFVQVVNNSKYKPEVRDYEEYPSLCRFDSVGNPKFVNCYRFSSIYKKEDFIGVLPAKDSLYIIGFTLNGPPLNYRAPYDTDPFVFKTDGNGVIDWKKKLGGDDAYEQIFDAIVTSDNGLLILGNAEPGYERPGQDKSVSERTFLKKFNADGTLKFDKAWQVRANSDTAFLYAADFRHMVETPDKGYLLIGRGIADRALKNDEGKVDLQMVKLDANGIIQWHKTLLHNTNIRPAKALNCDEIIPHPSGGYIIIGSIELGTYDSSGYHYGYFPRNSTQFTYYNTLLSGMLMTKISENGIVEWVKSIRIGEHLHSQYGQPYIDWRFDNIVPSSSTTEPGFIISGIKHEEGGEFGIYHYPFKRYVLKTDLNGKVLWNREYLRATNGGFQLHTGSAMLDNRHIFEEPGGTIVLNASLDASSYYRPYESNIMRLNSKGLYGDSSCAVSPKVHVFNEDPTFIYDTSTVFIELNPLPINPSFPNIVIRPLILPTYSTAICTNQLYVDIMYNISCTDTGTVVEFSDSSNGSWFHWDFGDLAINPNDVDDSSIVTHCYKNFGTYTVTLTVWDSDSSKFGTHKETITISPPRYITFNPDNITVCAGTTVTIVASISSGAFPTNYHFFVKSGNADDYASSFSDATFNTVPLDSSIALYKNIFGTTCIRSDTAVVTVLPTVHMTVTGDSLICSGDSSLLMASGSATYLWYPGNSANDSLWVYPLSTTTYTVSSGQNKVCGTDAAKIKVTVYPPTTIDAGAEQQIYLGTSAQLNASGGIKYYWSPSVGLSSATIFNPIATPTVTSHYTVMVTDANSCIAYDTVTVYIKGDCGDIYVPNAFSPNGDNNNEVLFPQGNCIKESLFTIFDRWGNKVFETNNINNGWDGTHKGKAMDPGVFVFNVNATLLTGETITKKGNVSLIK